MFLSGKNITKSYLNKLPADGIATNNFFQKFIKAFLKNSCNAQNDIMLNQKDEIMTQKKDLVETFDKHYISVVEKPSGIKLVNIAMMHNICDNDTSINVLNVITEAYKNHSSVTKTKEIIEKNTAERSFKFESVTKPYITTLLKNIDIKKPQA